MPCPAGIMRAGIRQKMRINLPVLFLSGPDESLDYVEVVLKPEHSLQWLARFAWRRARQGKVPKGTAAWLLGKSDEDHRSRFDDQLAPVMSFLEGLEDQVQVILLVGEAATLSTRVSALEDGGSPPPQ